MADKTLKEAIIAHMEGYCSEQITYALKHESTHLNVRMKSLETCVANLTNRLNKLEDEREKDLQNAMCAAIVNRPEDRSGAKLDWKNMTASSIYEVLRGYEPVPESHTKSGMMREAFKGVSDNFMKMGTAEQWVEWAKNVPDDPAIKAFKDFEVKSLDDFVPVPKSVFNIVPSPKDWAALLEMHMKLADANGRIAGLEADLKGTVKTLDRFRGYKAANEKEIERLLNTIAMLRKRKGE